MNHLPFACGVIVAVSLLSPVLAQSPAPKAAKYGVSFPRFPALSPDGKTVVFGYQGDLWSQSVAGSGEPARRITVHPAYESAPVFSPDGSKVAFQSSRYGANDVFVMRATGGEPRRVTNFSGGSTLQGWTPDGKSLLVSQNREHQRRGAAIYLIPADGGRAIPVLAISNLLTGTVSPDGGKIAFGKGSGDWERRGYRGAANADIWVYKTGVKQFVRVTDFDGQDLWPLLHPDGKSVVYVSERDGTYNLYRQVVGSEKAEQLTRYKGDGVRYPSLAASGSAVVYEIGDRVETLSLTAANAVPKPLTIVIAADDKITDLVTETKTSGADELLASPDAAQFGIAIQGDLFAVDRDGGRAARLTTDISRDGDMAWAKDGKSLLYIGNRDGNAEIYRTTSADPGEPLLSRSLKRTTTRLTKTPEREKSLSVSPDGKRVAFGRGDNTLLVGSADAVTDAKPIVTGKFPIGSYHWSPDSRYIVFSREDEEFNSDIYTVPADGSDAPRNVSMHPRNDYEPFWSPDGNKIFWTSERLDRRNDLYYVYLTESDDKRTGEQWARLREKAKTSKVADGTKPTKPAPVAVPAIEFGDIAMRSRRLTNLPGGESSPVVAPGADGHLSVVYTQSGGETAELTLLDFLDGGAGAGEKLSPPRKLATGGTSGEQWSGDGKTLFYLSESGAINAAPAIGGAAGEAKPVPYRARLSYSRSAMQSTVFQEAWETLRDEFYDPKHHGADWNALREKYAPVAAAASDPQDFYQVIRLLMGHLNSSHIGITPAQPFYSAVSASVLPTGALGVVWDEAHTGDGLKIGRVIKDSPASLAMGRLVAGEIVTGINGVRITATTDPDVLLADTVGERVYIDVTGTDGKTREVIVEPTSYGAIRTLLYEEWVDNNRRRVAEMSNGKLAYLHIRSMDKLSQDRFEQGLYAEAHGKNALLLDVRDNGGGSTADYLLTMLSVPRHAYTIGRDGEPGYPQDRLPLYSWYKPAGLLINQNSYSNAEIFAHAFRAINRGDVFGVATFGAVISTGGRRLLDGSNIRTPGRGWYLIKTGVNEEHTGAQPTVPVELSPADELAGADPQLSGAVKTMLKTGKVVPLPVAKPARYAVPPAGQAPRL